ncbi:MAG: Gfo/Idh/MocA family oxidoreductase, partial [Bacteroidota bacterium]
MTPRVKIGVVGVGHLGSLHAKMLSEMQDVEFIGVYDIDAEKNMAVAQEFGVKPYLTYDELLEGVEAISIATPTSTHFGIAAKALEKKVHTFIEKPLTETVDEAEQLVRLSKQKNAKVQVGHVERFNPALLALEKYNINPKFIESHMLEQFNHRGSD